jgi:hypothetical protein
MKNISKSERRLILIALLICSLILWVFAVKSALSFGYEWNSEVYPPKVVELTLATGDVVKGALKETTEETITVTLSSGKELAWNLDQVTKISFDKPSPSEHGIGWRSWLLAIFVTGCFFVFGAFLNSKILDIKTMGEEPNVLEN